jgi:hypothetical protein
VTTIDECAQRGEQRIARLLRTSGLPPDKNLRHAPARSIPTPHSRATRASAEGPHFSRTPTANLVQELLAAKRDLRLPQVLAKLDRFECAFLDDIGYV